MRNYSGFSGFNIANLYPDMGSGVTQTLETVPDPEEQASLSAQEPEKKVSPAVSGSSRNQIWLVVAILVGLVVAFSGGHK